MENQPEKTPPASAKTIETLRDHLFKQIEILNANPTEMDFKRASSVTNVAQTIINSAKVEVEMVHALNSKQLTGFMANAPKPIVIEGDSKPAGETLTAETTGQIPDRLLNKKLKHQEKHPEKKPLAGAMPNNSGKTKLSDQKPGAKFTHRC